VNIYARFRSSDSRGWLVVVIDSLSHTVLNRVVVILWAIWHARRKAIHESLSQSPLSTHKFVEKFISELELLKFSQRRIRRDGLLFLGGSLPQRG
jgi:hypothetical protein